MTAMTTSDAGVEYAAARRGVALIDRREYGVLEATGGSADCDAPGGPIDVQPVASRMNVRAAPAMGATRLR